MSLESIGDTAPQAVGGEHYNSTAARLVDATFGSGACRSPLEAHDIEDLRLLNQVAEDTIGLIVEKILDGSVPLEQTSELRDDVLSMAGLSVEVRRRIDAARLEAQQQIEATLDRSTVVKERGGEENGEVIAVKAARNRFLELTGPFDEAVSRVTSVGWDDMSRDDVLPDARRTDELIDHLSGIGWGADVTKELRNRHIRFGFALGVVGLIAAGTVYFGVDRMRSEAGDVKAYLWAEIWDPVFNGDDPKHLRDSVPIDAPMTPTGTIVSGSNPNND